MATHSSVLAWRIPGTGKPGGLPSMGSHRVGHDWSDLAAAAARTVHSSFQACFAAITLTSSPNFEFKHLLRKVSQRSWEYYVTHTHTHTHTHTNIVVKNSFQKPVVCEKWSILSILLIILKEYFLAMCKVGKLNSTSNYRLFRTALIYLMCSNVIFNKCLFMSSIK